MPALMPLDHWDGHRRMRNEGIDLTTNAQARLTTTLSGSKFEILGGGGIVIGNPV